MVSPPADISRPVTDKVRAAIFNTLSGRSERAEVLDLYAGSGALGFEALSRGASHTVMVDQSSGSVRAIKQTVVSLNLSSQVVVIRSKVEKIIDDYLAAQKKFDLIFFDPPYAMFDIEVMKKTENLLQYSGLLIVSCSSKTDLPAEVGGLELIQQKVYGGTRIGYFKKFAV